MWWGACDGSVVCDVSVTCAESFCGCGLSKGAMCARNEYTVGILAMPVLCPQSVLSASIPSVCTSHSMSVS